MRVVIARDLAYDRVSVSPGQLEHGVARMDVAAAARPGNRRRGAGPRGSALQPGVAQERPGRGRAEAEVPGPGGLQRAALVQVPRRRRRSEVRPEVRPGS